LGFNSAWVSGKRERERERERQKETKSFFPYYTSKGRRRRTMPVKTTLFCFFLYLEHETVSF